MNHELNAQVAEEVMGWKDTRVFYKSLSGMAPDGKPFLWGKQYPAPVPDFSGSLDAAWEMEEEIERRELHMRYVCRLIDVFSLKSKYIMIPEHWRLIHATPEQRCRAALEAVREK